MRHSHAGVVVPEVFQKVEGGVGVDVVVGHLGVPVVVVQSHPVVQLVDVEVALPPPGQREPEPQLVNEAQLRVLPPEPLLGLEVPLLHGGDSQTHGDVLVLVEPSLENVSGELVKRHPVSSLNRRRRGVEHIMVKNRWWRRWSNWLGNVASCDCELSHFSIDTIIIINSFESIVLDESQLRN